MDNLSKIELVRSKCTRFAEKFLHELETSPIFPEILERLLELRGTITRSDIERIFVELRNPPER